MAHPNAELISRFYTAFAARDADGMAACYHPQIHFSDPVFPDLSGPQAPGMWKMLCERGKDLVITFSDVQADDQTGSARWDAVYTFSTTGRKVHNRVHAQFRFEGGLIREHRDDFDFFAWSRMALGPAGWFLGWTPIIKNKVRAQAGGQLERYLAKQG